MRYVSGKLYQDLSLESLRKRAKFRKNITGEDKVTTPSAKPTDIGICIDIFACASIKSRLAS